MDGWMEDFEVVYFHPLLLFMAFNAFFVVVVVVFFVVFWQITLMYLFRTASVSFLALKHQTHSLSLADFQSA